MANELQEQFTENVRIENENYEQCWEWVGNKYWDGYGVLNNMRAHRFSYEMYIGPIPAGMYVCHRCDNPGCVNPDHLFVGTQTDNMRDMVEKGRHSIGNRKGENHPMAQFTNKEVEEIRRLYETGNYTQRELAKMYNTAFQNINRIVKNQVYKKPFEPPMEIK